MWFSFFSRDGNGGKTFQVQCLKRARKKKTQQPHFCLNLTTSRNENHNRKPLWLNSDIHCVCCYESRSWVFSSLQRYCLIRPSMVTHASNPALRRLEQENANSRQLGLQIPNFFSPFLKHPCVRVTMSVCERVCRGPRKPLENRFPPLTAGCRDGTWVVRLERQASYLPFNCFTGPQFPF